MLNKNSLKIIYSILVIGLSISCSGKGTPRSNDKSLADNKPTGINSNKLDSTKYADFSPFTYSIGGKITPEEAQNYDFIVVESSSYDQEQISALKSTGTTVLGYLSVGEVGPYRWYYDILKKQGFLGENKNWNADFLNLADSVTYQLFFDAIIPRIMKRGFDGLFLDTVDDVASYTPRANLQPDMVRLIKQIKKEYPQIMVVQNDGLFLLDKVHNVIDAVLKEDIATLYNFRTKSYTLRTPKSYQKQVDLINDFSGKYHIPFLIVDYAVSDSLRVLVQSRLDTLKYPYYIGDIGLDNVLEAVTGNNY